MLLALRNHWLEYLFEALGLVSSWAILEGQITIVLESRSHEKTGATGACELEACVSRLTFNESGLCADPSRMPEMPQILARTRPSRGTSRVRSVSHACALESCAA
jgi:hypothetical protein